MEMRTRFNPAFNNLYKKWLYTLTVLIPAMFITQQPLIADIIIWSLAAMAILWLLAAIEAIFVTKHILSNNQKTQKKIRQRMKQEADLILGQQK